ncbi:hypothetical protein H7F33_11690 [Pedobacter sp. PAMC26386]|nr:hypothetical protein H7F33_11690 [Pedobacter sp. PAMC26386]
MIYISAQPDEYYFYWQIKLQIFNFSRMGIAADRIHVLIGYNENRGLSDFFSELINLNKQATFYAYPDKRISKKYASSIRPHLLATHFRINSWLEHQVLFYHDSDIIFRHLPDFKLLLEGDEWFASDTWNYTSIDYIIKTSNAALLKEMISIVGIDIESIEENDKHSGGAQYVLKNVTSAFWLKLEADCEKMFGMLENYNAQSGFYVEGKQKFESWCTDMWCLWWNAILIQKNVRTHVQLSFSWAETLIEIENPIIHYTGRVAKENKGIFRKNNYVNGHPFYAQFNSINKGTASYLVVKEIELYNLANEYKLHNFDKFTFILKILDDGSEQVENLYIIVNYLSLNFSTRILVLVCVGHLKLDNHRLSKQVSVCYVSEVNPSLISTTQLLDRLVVTPFVFFYDQNSIIPVSDILALVGEFEKTEAGAINICCEILLVDLLLKEMFSKYLTDELLIRNRGKFFKCEKFSGAFIIGNKELLIQSLGDNDHFLDFQEEMMLSCVGIDYFKETGNKFYYLYN